MTAHELDIKLLGRRFTLKCAEGEEKELQQAAEMLEQKLEQLQSSLPRKDMDQLALLAALNLSHDLILEQHRNQAIIRSMESRIKTLQATVERALPKTPNQVNAEQETN